MNPLILYDGFTIFYHFYFLFGHGVESPFLFLSHKKGSAGSCIYLFSLYTDR